MKNALQSDICLYKQYEFFIVSYYKLMILTVFVTNFTVKFIVLVAKLLIYGKMSANVFYYAMEMDLDVIII